MSTPTLSSLDLFLQIRMAPADGLWLRLVSTPAELLLVTENTPFEKAPPTPLPDEVFKCELDDLRYSMPRKRRREPTSAAEAREKAGEWWHGQLGAWLRLRLEAVLLHLQPEARQKCLVRVNVTTLSMSAWMIPWEWLEEPLQAHARERGLLGPQARLCVARASVEHFTPPPLPVPGRLRLLATASAPGDEPMLDVQEELALLNNVTGLERHTCEAELEEMYNDMAESQTHVLHFIGHASVDGDDGSLILTSQGGRASDWAGSRRLARLLLPSVRLVCLSTCVTAPNYDIRGFARLALKAITSRDSALAPSMVYTQFPISREAAAAFWPVFYNDLADNGGDLYEAFARARCAVRDQLPERADWSSFVLLVVDTFEKNKNAGRPFALLAGPQRRSWGQPVGAGTQSINAPLGTRSPASSGQKRPAHLAASTLSPENLQSFLAINLANQLQSHLVDYEQQGKVPTQEDLLNSGKKVMQQAAEGVVKHFAHRLWDYLKGEPEAPRDAEPEQAAAAYQQPQLTVGMKPCLETLRSDLEQVKGYIRD